VSRAIGGLRVLLTLEAPAATDDGGGGRIAGWRRVGAMWADLRPVSAWEREAGGARLATVSHRAIVRAAPRGAEGRPAAGRRFSDGSRNLLIRAVSEADPRGQRLICWVEEETPA
jgi:head-tail adaptor